MPEEGSEGGRRHGVAVVAACTFPALRGSQVLVRAVAEHAAAAGHRVHLVTYGGDAAYDPPPGVRLHAPPPRLLRPPVGLGWSKPLHDLRLLRLLRRVVAEEKIDVIHAHNYEAPLLAYRVRARFGVPVVYHAHNALADELATYVAPGWRRRLAARLGRRLDEQVPRRADHVIALTPELADFLAGCGVDRGRLTVLPPLALPDQEPGVPADDGPEVSRPDGDGRRFVVLYAGNLDPYQDLDVLFAAFARLRAGCPGAVLEVATHDGAWRRRLDPRAAGWVAEGAVRVRVEPDFAAVRRRMAAADVLVCPRSSWSGYPIKLVNYALAGRPVVVAAGSAKGLADAGGVVVVADRDPEALAQALARMVREPGHAAALAVAARQRAARLAGGAEFASHLDAIYGKITTERGGPGGSGVTSTSRLRRAAGGRISSLSPDGGPG